MGRGGFPRQNPCCSPFPCPLLALPRLSLLQAVPLTLLGGKKQRERAPGWAQKRAASESAPPAARQRGEILLSEADRGFTRLHYGTRASNKSSEAHKRTQANAESAPHAPGASPGSVCFRWLQGASGGRGGQSQVRSRTQHAWMAQGITPVRLQPGWRGEGEAPGSPQPPAQAWRAVWGGEGARCCQKGARPLRATAAGWWPRGDVRLRRGREPRGSTPRHTEHGGEAGQGPRSSPHEAVPPGVSPGRAAGTVGVGTVRRQSRWQSEPGAAGGSRRPAEADLFASLPAFLLPHFFPMTSA